MYIISPYNLDSLRSFSWDDFLFSEMNHDIFLNLF
jgi:hypothetical protein